MRRRAPIPLALLALALLSGCGEDAEPSNDRLPDPRHVERQGEALYGRYCALCHGRDGEGYAADDAPALANPEWLRTASDEFITRAIRDGRTGTAMSAWSRRHGGPLGDPQISAILTYLRTWQRTPRSNVDEVAVNGDPTRGRLIYLLKCASCHGPRGEGVDAIALGNPRFQETASDGFIQYAVTHGRSGTRMESFADQLTPAQIDDVVAFVRSFGQGAPQPREPQLVPDQQDPDMARIPSLSELDLVINPGGRTPRFHLREERFVSAADVHAALDRGQRMILLDARATSDWLYGRIPGSLPVPFYEMDDILESLPRDGTWMIAYCGCPHAASGHVVDALRANGFTHTAVLDEGVHYWEEQHWPMTHGPDQP